MSVRRGRRLRSARWLVALLLLLNLVLAALSIVVGAVSSAGCHTVAGCPGNEYLLADALTVAFYSSLGLSVVTLGALLIRGRRRARRAGGQQHR